MLSAVCIGRPSATIATPQSYGTLSVLWASVDQESASSKPSARCRNRGDAAAQRPNAPSTCTHAPAVVRDRDRGLEVVERARVDVARPAAARSSTRCRPRASRGAGRRGCVPAHRSAQRSGCRGRGSAPARSMAPWRSAPTMKRTAGHRRGPPFDIPAARRRMTTSRAAARHVNWAIVAPVDEADLAARGEAEQVEQPLAGELLGGRRHRRDDAERRSSGPTRTRASPRRARSGSVPPITSRRSAETALR